MPGAVTVVVPAPDSQTYAFMAMSGAAGGAAGAGAGGGPGLYTIAEDGTHLQRLNTTVSSEGGRGGRGRGGFFGGFNEPQWARDGRTIYLLQGGGIYAISVPAQPAGEGAPAAAAPGRGGRGGASASAESAAGAAPRRVTFTVRMVIDRPAERRQVFEEAWRVMKNRFYDPKMHGVNWAAAKDKYESLLPHVADTEELHNVVMEMIGELDASHTGISGGGAVARRAAARRAHPDALSRLRAAAGLVGLLQDLLHHPQRTGRQGVRQAEPRATSFWP